MTLDDNSTPQIKIWAPSENLPERIQKLRDHFYSFSNRPETNEPYSFTTGTDWDEVYSVHDWANEPALYAFFPSVNQTLKAMTVKVDLPTDYWDHSLAKRRAIFFHEVMTKYMPVIIIDGELIVGFNFNTALSRSLNKSETSSRNKEMKKYFKEATRLNEVGVGTASAVPGHLIPNYAKVMRVGLRGIAEEYEELLKRDLTPEHREFVESLILGCQTARDVSSRYAKKARELVPKERNISRKDELEKIAHTCERVPWEAPSTFCTVIR